MVYYSSEATNGVYFLNYAFRLQKPIENVMIEREISYEDGHNKQNSWIKYFLRNCSTIKSHYIDRSFNAYFDYLCIFGWCWLKETQARSMGGGSLSNGNLQFGKVYREESTLSLSQIYPYKNFKIFPTKIYGYAAGGTQFWADTFGVVHLLRYALSWRWVVRRRKNRNIKKYIIF